jgi:hypothetical protein
MRKFETPDRLRLQPISVKSLSDLLHLQSEEPQGLKRMNNNTLLPDHDEYPIFKRRDFQTGTSTSL